MHLLLAQLRVPGRQHHPPRLFFGANPDGARAANQGEGIVPDDFRRAVEFQVNRVIREWPNGAELVGYAQNNAGGVSPIGV